MSNKNKKNLYLSGLFSRSSLIYYTNRKYILWFVLLLLIFYTKFNRGLLHNIVRVLLYAFSTIEFVNVLYVLHFHFTHRKVCEIARTK